MINPIGAAGFAQQRQFNSLRVRLELNQNLQLERILREKANKRALAKKRAAEANTTQPFQLLFNKGVKVTTDDLWHKAGKRSVFAREVYDDRIHAGCKQSGRAVGHRPKTAPAFGQFRTTFMPGGGQQERVRIAKDQNKDWDSSDPPMKLSKNFRALVPPPPKEFKFHCNRRTAQDMKSKLCRKSAKAAPFKDHPNGIKNEVALRAQEKPRWVGNNNFRLNFRPSTMENAAKVPAKKEKPVQAPQHIRARASRAPISNRKHELSTHSITSVSHFPTHYPLGKKTAWGANDGGEESIEEQMKQREREIQLRQQGGRHAKRPASAGGALVRACF
jgi:hypothetical protein